MYVDYYNKYYCEAGPPPPPIQTTRDKSGTARMSLPSDEDHHAWLVRAKAYWAAFALPPAPLASSSPSQASSSPSAGSTRINSHSWRLTQQRLAQQRIARSKNTRARLRATIKAQDHQILHAAAALHNQQTAHKAETSALLAVVEGVVDKLDAIITCSGCHANRAQYSLHYVESAQHTLCDACIATHASKLVDLDWSWQYCPSCSKPGQWQLTSLTSNPAFAETVTAWSHLESILPPNPYANTSAPLQPPAVSALDAGAIAHALQQSNTIDLDDTASVVSISGDES